jgi:hypothetical protein
VSTVEWLVVLGGVLALGLVNWWFFLAGDRSMSHEHHHHH